MRFQHISFSLIIYILTPNVSNIDHLLNCMFLGSLCFNLTKPKKLSSDLDSRCNCEGSGSTGKFSAGKED